jgi:hypothetical protein
VHSKVNGCIEVRAKNTKPRSQIESGVLTSCYESLQIKKGSRQIVKGLRHRAHGTRQIGKGIGM